MAEHGAWPLSRDLEHADHAELFASMLPSIGHKRVHVVGHSYGGAIAAQLALDHPQLISKLVLIEPSLPMILEGSADESLLMDFVKLNNEFRDAIQRGANRDAWRMYVDGRNGAGAWDALDVSAQEKILGGTAQALSVAVATIKNSLRLTDFRSMASPSLVVCGDRTTPRDAATAKALQSVVPGCASAVVEGSGHMSPGTHPRELAEIIIGFLAS